MKQVILTIPDNKYQFFMELLKSFEYLTVEERVLEIPEEQKAIVRERMKASDADPSRLLDWDKAKQQLKFKNA
jgi:hypothetical protein